MTKPLIGKGGIEKVPQIPRDKQTVKQILKQKIEKNVNFARNCVK